LIYSCPENVKIIGESINIKKLVDFLMVFNGYFDTGKPRGTDKITKLESSKSVVLKKTLVCWIDKFTKKR